MERYSIYKLNSLASSIINTFENYRNIEDISSLKKSSLNTLRNIQDIALRLNLLEIVAESINIENSLENNEPHEFITKTYESFIRCNILIQKIMLRKDNIIVISENPKQFMQFIKNMITENFYVKVTDSNIIEEAIARLPEFIIMDIKDKENCLTTLKALKYEGTTKTIPVFVIGENHKDFKLSALNNGAIGFINSPFDSNELYLLVSNLHKLLLRDKNDLETDSDLHGEKYGKALSTNLIKLCNIKNRNLAFLLIDIDNTAGINMQIGEKRSNTLIRDIIEIIKSNISGEDFIFRNHGDEFCIVLIDKSIPEVQEISEKMLSQVKLLNNVYNVDVSFSGGIAYLSTELNDFNKIYKEAVCYKNKAKLNGKGTIFWKKDDSEKLSKKLLIIDNDRVILSILANRYTSKGYSVSTFEDPQEALVALKKSNFHLVITNFYMETVNGAMLIKSIREISKSIKVIVLSGQKSEDSIKSALESGADDYIKKPFSPMELDLRIDRYFR